MFVTDYSAARPGGQRLQDAHCVGAVRYAAKGRSDVNISHGEVDDLLGHGIPVGIVNEHEADYMLRRVGSDCASQAEDVAHAAGLPPGVTYFAMDFDATNDGPTTPGSPGDQNMTKIAHFLNSAAAIIQPENVGGYGSYYALQWLRDHLGWRLDWEWQTEAWSHTLILPGIRMYQHANPSPIPGCDFDSTIFGDWGQRHNPLPPPKLDPRRFDFLVSMPLAGSQFLFHGPVVLTAQECLNDLIVPGWTPLLLDGVWGQETAGAVIQYQKNRGLLVDAVVGKQVWSDFRALLLERKIAHI